MLSSLAEGADRLTARIALRSNMKLVAVLPLPQDRYEEDFTTPEVLNEFRALLERSIGVIRLPLLDGITDDQIKTPGDARNREYAKAGAYIAAHSQVFFAFWDGTPHTGDKVGGTAQTVDFRMQGAQAPYVGRRSGRMFGVAAGPVLHIATPRTSNPASASLTPKLTRLLPPNMREDAFDRICERMDAFNRDAKTIRDVLGRGVRDRLAGLLNMPASDAPSMFERLPAGCRKVVEHYLVADGLALQYRAHALSTWKRVYIGVVIAALFFNLHSSFFAVTQDAPVSFTDAVIALPWFLIGSLACSTFTAAWLYGRAQKGEYQTKYPRLSRARRSAANSVLLENRRHRRTGGRLVSAETAQRPGMDPERAAIVRRDSGCSRATRRSDGALALGALRHDIQMDRRSAALLFVQSDD